MAITKVINDAVDLNQTSDYSGLRLPVGTTGDVVESFTTDYLVVGGGGGNSGDSPGGAGAGGLRTSYNNSTTTTNSLSFPSGKTAIATYMLDNNATDVSGNYNGTETNITYNTGKYGGGAVFNGSNSKIDLGNNTSNNTSTISVSLWFKTAGHSNTAALINNGGSNSGETGYYLGLNSNGTIKFEAGTGTVNGSVNYADSQWHQIVLTLNSGAYNIYVDGNTTPVITGSGAFTTTATRPTWIGQFSYTPAAMEFFDGLIDQVRIYDTALSGTDSSNIYNNEVQALSGGGNAAESSLTLNEGVAYDVTVGAGGASATIGSSSIFNTITSSGGGRGGGNSGGYNGGNGGSGGGGGGGSYSSSGGNGTIAQGYAGGTSGASGGGTSYPGGGGGGAAAVGASPTNSGSNGGNGGAGLSVNILNSTNASASYIGQVSGSNVYYAGGGGGSTYQGTAGNGGVGGGGNGDRSDDGTAANNGTANTGGGGAGTNATGGSGVVILRYPTANVSSFTTTGTLNTPSTTDTLANNNYPVTNVAYYKLDGDAADSSGNGYTGTASNVTWQNGRFNQAGAFNGSTSIINLSTYSAISQQNNFSLSFWLKPNGFAASSAIVKFYSSYRNYVELGLNGILGFNATGSQVNTPSGSITDGVWQHVAITKSSTDGTVIYVNNVAVVTSSSDTGNASDFSSYSYTNYLGGWDGSSYGFPGDLDQVRIFSSALSASNVTDLYNEHYQTKFTDGSDTAIVFTEGTGTVTFSGTNPAPPQGALRTNTSESEDGSASVIEHYNGTEWKYFDAIKL